ncbi:MAG TPA: hypothetical protein VHM91_13155, partial [Verrucomicrobiales bacterium]|nr:hypothetical protein [Verrucomicrobiales bacterium]
LRSHLNIEGGGTIFFNGMGVSMLPNSLTEFVGGTLRSTHPLALTGTVFAHELGGVAPSIVMDGDALLDFGNTSINIFSRLRVTAARAIVRATTRSNSTDGTLVFESGSGVAVESEAILGCSVENHGRMDLGRFPSPAPFSIVGLNQMAGGVLALPLHGPGDLSHVVSAEGVVRLGGTLELTLASGYVPQEGDRLNAITAGNGIIGKFGRIVQPQGMPPGLMFVPEVTLFPDVLHLTATVTTPYEEWRKSYPALTDPESFAKSADPDGDGLPNIGEFALHGNPAGDPAEQNLHPRVITVNSAPVFTCTLAMRAGAVPDPNDPTGGPLVLHQSADSLRYTVQGSPDLTAWNAPVTELTGEAALSLQADLPPLEAAWEYRTFTAGESGKYLRVTVTE